MRQEPIRPWSEVPAGSGPDEQMAALFRRVDVAVNFHPARVPLRALAPRPEPARWRFALVAVAFLLLGSAGAVAAVSRIPALSMWLVTKAATHAPVERPLAPPLAPSPEPPAAVVPPAAPVAQAESAAAPAPVMRRTARAHHSHRLALLRRAKARRRANAGQAAPSLPVATEKPRAAEEPEVTAEPESQLARETQLLEEAYTELRSEHDPGAALDALDRYLNAYPLGLLRKEATSARVEALLDLKRPIDALAALRSYPFGEGARDLELRVLRAELAAGRDCKEALEDFEAVSELVARKAAGPVQERALYGRAACQARLGQRDDAAEGFRAYLRQFPSGRFAAQARRQLGEAEK